MKKGTQQIHMVIKLIIQVLLFTLDKETYGNKWLKLSKEHPEYFKNSKAFIENVFKGVYIKSDYGDGTVLYVDRVDLQMKYQFYVIDTATNVPYKRKQAGFENEDSTAHTWRTEFASTKEVIQANQFLNSDKIQKLAAEDEHTYIKSPAGIFTEAELPYDDIYQKLANDTLNAVKLTFTNYNKQDSPYEFSMSAPSNVLLLRKVDFKSFFEENKLPDNITSYTVKHNNVATNQYTFNNIARLVTTCIQGKDAAMKKAKEEAGDKWNQEEWEKDWRTVYLIPVSITYDTTSSSTSSTMTGIQNDLQPGYAMLKGGPKGEALKLEVTYTTFNK